MNFEVIAVLNGSISSDAPDGSTWRDDEDQHHRRRDVFAPPQALLQRRRRIPLRHAQRAGDLGEQLLERPERTQPAAEHAAPDQHHRDQRVGGDDHHQRLGEIEADVEVAERRHHVIDDVDRRELHARGPAEPDQDDQQKAVAHQPMGEAVARELRLEDEDQGEHREQHREDRDVDLGVLPRIDPRRSLRLGIERDREVAGLVGDRRDRAAGAAAAVWVRRSAESSRLVRLSRSGTL